MVFLALGGDGGSRANLPASCQVISVAPTGLSVDRIFLLCASDTCPGIWTVLRPTVSGLDDGVRVCGIPSRYPCLPSPGLPEAARSAGRLGRMDVQLVLGHVQLTATAAILLSLLVRSVRSGS